MKGTVKPTVIRLVCVALGAVTMTGLGSAPHSRAVPAEQMAVMVMSSGGMIPPALSAMQSPSLAAFADGRVLTATKVAARQLVPARYLLARVDPAMVTDFVTAALGSGLLDGSADFGTPRFTDLATTTMVVDSGRERLEVAVYALDERFEDGLTAGQRDARTRLRELIAQAFALPTGVATVPYTPDRVSVYEPLAAASGEPASTVWPGPPPQSFLVPTRARRSNACGLLSGAPARAVYLAALDNPGARWLVDGVTRVLAVNPLPLEGDCP